MANTKSAIKRIKVTARKTLRNKMNKSRMRTMVVKFERSLNTKAGDAGTALVRALSAIDRAASKGVIHPNAAARKKSRLSRRFNRLNAQGA